MPIIKINENETTIRVVEAEYLGEKKIFLALGCLVDNDFVESFYIVKNNKHTRSDINNIKHINIVDILHDIA